MYTRKRCVWFLALTTVVALTAACGGQAEEPAPAPAAAEEPAAADPAPAAVPEPDPEPEPEQEPEFQLVGNIVEVALGPNEQQFDWLTAASREVPGRYYWLVKLRNDTTSVLDITVTWEFLNESEEVIKTDRATVRVAPAETGTFRVEGEMNRDNSRAVAYTSYTWGWRPVESG